MPSKMVLVLANSIKKKPGRCIAGREVTREGGKVRLGGWIRPVSPDGTSQEGELLPQHMQTERGERVKVLDLFEIPFARPRTDPGQPENWEVCPDVPWRRIGAVPRTGLPQLIEEPSDLWDWRTPGDRRIEVSAPATILGRSSLTMVKPKDFKVAVTREYNRWLGRERTVMRGVFALGDRTYGLDITDDSFVPSLRTQAVRGTREYRMSFGDECALCVSLGGPFEGHHYKLIAAVIPFADASFSAVPAVPEIPF